MSKNRIKQRKNRQACRYVRALESHSAMDWSNPPFGGELSPLDECGRKDLTGYNAINHMENRNWTIVL